MLTASATTRRSTKNPHGSNLPLFTTPICGLFCPPNQRLRHPFPTGITVINQNMCLPESKLSRQEKIDLLNERVVKITAKEVQKAKQAGRKLAPEFVYAQQKMTTLTAGSPVYQLRSSVLVYAYAIGTALLILKGATMLHPLTTALCVLTMFLGYDFYSGVLHVVLDHPDNIALPILGQPCLEFQWHHAIPDDLVRKDFVDVCGDLNVVVMILAAINLYLLDLNSGVAMVIGGLKLWMAYFGQFSHKSAHAFGPARGGFATWLQKYGFMISCKDHMSHHKPPYDVDFCLIGFCNPAIDALRSLTTNNAAWLSLFFVWSILDLVGYVKLVEEASKVLQIA
eukprot:scaffold6722_cov173-Amphora_coffeaeformis.AAC.8